MKQRNFAISASRMLVAIMAMVFVSTAFVSCTDQFKDNETISAPLNTKAPAVLSEVYGEDLLNDTTKKDSVIKPDGTIERVALKFKIVARDHREVIVDNFKNPNTGETFFTSNKKLLESRKEGNWLIYAYAYSLYKGIEVGNTGETVSYDAYEEVATYVPTSHDFTSEGWKIENISDTFKGAPISSKEGYSELDYANGVKAIYTGVNNSKECVLKETISFFAKGDVPVIDHYDATGDRADYTTYTSVIVEKFATYTDGARESIDKISAELPINVIPETHWTLDVDKLGTYVANEFTYTLVSVVPKKFGNFSYNEYTYRASNTVEGKTNSVLITVPNDIVYEDKDVKHEFKNTSLVVTKGSEATIFSGEDSAKKTYSYTCVANVEFGASQSVTLPGTINVTKITPVVHDHGKIVATYMTSTPDENRSYWKNVAVIAFEDGYRMVGLADNNAMSFNFTMTSYSDVNSAVYANGQWIPSKAEDNTSSRCMIWRDENNAPKRTLDFITATRNAWNNGHNTVTDVRREGKISDGGYTVTFYLNGIAGQKLSF